MPIASTWQEFLTARATQRTNTTKRLTEIFVKANHADYFGTGNQPEEDWRGWLFTPDALSTSLPAAGAAAPNVREFVKGGGPVATCPPHVDTGAGLAADLLDVELEHIDDWPNPQKEEVRKALQTAIERGCAVEFHWAVHNGDYETTEIVDPGEDPGGKHQPIKITFHSPWKFVKLHINASNQVEQVNVNVNEYPENNITGP